LATTTKRAPRGERDQHQRHAEGEPHVLTDDVARDVRQSDQLRQPPQVGSQQRDVCTAEGDLVELRADGDTDVGAAQGAHLGQRAGGRAPRDDRGHRRECRCRPDENTGAAVIALGRRDRGSGLGDCIHDMSAPPVNQEMR
jgi:hypothetical protein